MDDEHEDFLGLKPAPQQNPASGRRGGAPPITGRRAFNFDFDAQHGAPAPDTSGTLVELAAGTAEESVAADRSGAEQGAAQAWDEADVAALKPPSLQQVGLPAGANKTVLEAALDIFGDDDEEPTAAPSMPPAASTVSRRKQEQLAESSRQQADKYAVERELALDTLEELDDSGKLDLTGQIAEAPKVRQVQQVHGLEQLEDAKLRNLKQFISGAGSAAREGDGAEPAIDLSLLLSALLPEHLVREPDEVWDEELLLTKVAAELQAPGERPERPSMAVQSS